MVSVNAPLGAPVESPYGEWDQWSGLGEDWTGQEHGQVWEAMDAPLGVSKEPKDSLRALLEWQEARGMHVTGFTKVLNRGMAFLVWEVLGGAGGTWSRGSSFRLPRETAFLGICPSGLSKIPQRVRLELPSPGYQGRVDREEPTGSLAGPSIELDHGPGGMGPKGRVGPPL